MRVMNCRSVKASAGRRKLWNFFAAILVAGLVASLTADGFGQNLQLTRVATGLSSPIFVTHAPGDTSRLFIAEQGGNIRILNLGTGTVNATPFLTSAQLQTGGTGLTSGGERGLLGLAFDPNYATNRRFYVNYTDGSGNTRIRSFQRSVGSADLADTSAIGDIMSITQPFNNHNGGWMGFGPDGFLYIGTGDGGSGNDPQNNGLNRNTLLGKMLRIAPNTTAVGGYSIPGSNPFVGTGFREEIWAYGLRNPWRNSFDRQTGDLYIGDVGQGTREEVSFQYANSAGGQNYGWRVKEGMFTTGLTNGGLTGLAPDTNPIYDYLHNSGTFGGFSITGGYVYRGPLAGFQGHYFFADYVSQKLFSLRFNGALPGQFNGTNFDSLIAWNGNITFIGGGTGVGSVSSFGEDALGNLYIVDHSGNVYRFSGGAVPEPGSLAVLGIAITGLLSFRRRRA